MRLDDGARLRRRGRGARGGARWRAKRSGGGVDDVADASRWAPPRPRGAPPGGARRGSRGDPISARGRKTQGSRVWVGAGSRPSTRSGDFDAPRGVGRSAHPGGNAPRRAFSICVPSGSSGSACAWKCAPARGDATRRRAGAGRTTPRARGPAGRVRGPRVGASAGARTREPRAAEIADQRADAGADDAIGAVRARMRGGRRPGRRRGESDKAGEQSAWLGKDGLESSERRHSAVRRFRLDRAGHENLIRLVRDIFRIFRIFRCISQKQDCLLCMKKTSLPLFTDSFPPSVGSFPPTNEPSSRRLRTSARGASGGGRTLARGGRSRPRRDARRAPLPSSGRRRRLSRRGARARGFAGAVRYSRKVKPTRRAPSSGGFARGGRRSRVAAGPGLRLGSIAGTGGTFTTLSRAPSLETLDRVRVAGLARARGLGRENGRT